MRVLLLTGSLWHHTRALQLRVWGLSICCSVVAQMLLLFNICRMVLPIHYAAIVQQCWGAVAHRVLPAGSWPEVLRRWVMLQAQEKLAAPEGRVAHMCRHCCCR